MAGESATAEKSFDAFVKEALDNNEYSTDSFRISEGEAKAILDRLYGENRKKAIRETKAEWRSLSLRVRTWLQGEMKVTIDGKFGPEIRDALLRRERGLKKDDKLTYFGETEEEVRDGNGIEFREEGTAIGRFIKGVLGRGMFFYKGAYALPKNVQNAPSAQEAMKTAAFDGVMFQGIFDSEGKPQDGAFFVASNRKMVCEIAGGEVCEGGAPKNAEDFSVFSEGEKKILGEMFAQAEKMKISEV